MVRDRISYRVERSSRADRLAFGTLLIVVLALLSVPAWAGRAEMHLLVEICYYLALAQAWNLLAGFAGLVSVGQQAYVGLGCYAFITATVFLGLAPLLALPLAAVFVVLLAWLASFAVFRVALGLGEAAVFPASVKAVAEWFPQKERALATGIFNAGTNIGAMLTPLVVPWLVRLWGWRGAFLGVGALGFLWLALWLLIYRRPEEHPWVSRTELDYIQCDPMESVQKTTLSQLLPLRQTWAFALGKFFIDPAWWFYLFWLPAFLERKHGLSLQQIFIPILVVYLISDAGSVAGGWISSSLIKRGKSINVARKTAMLICAIGVVPVVFVPHFASMWNAVLLIGLAAAAHQGFSANLYTLTSDMFPNRAIGSVVGFGGMLGALGGLLIASVVGHVLQRTGSYEIPFLIAGVVYFVALGLIQILAPRLNPPELNG